MVGPAVFDVGPEFLGDFCVCRLCVCFDYSFNVGPIFSPLLFLDGVFKLPVFCSVLFVFVKFVSLDHLSFK